MQECIIGSTWVLIETSRIANASEPSITDRVSTPLNGILGIAVTALHFVHQD